MYQYEDVPTNDPLGGWLAAGGLRDWVAAHGGEWNHDDWLRLLQSLQPQRWTATERRMLGAALEEAKQQHANLTRWRQTGAARRWMADRQGRWDHDDWVALIWELQEGGFWPIDPVALGRLLEEEQRRWSNLHEWVDSGDARRWVAERHGHWTEQEWQALARQLEAAAGGPIDLGRAAAVLERYRAAWWSLQRWRQAGGDRIWIERHEDGWSHDEWLALVRGLEYAGHTVEPEWLGAALEETWQRYANVRRWQQRGAARRWVEQRQGEWDHGAWLALLGDIERAVGPIDPGRVGLVLEQEQRRYRNLCWWQRSEDARAWVTVRRGEWDHRDWVELLARMERSAAWPVYPDAVAELMERLRREYHGSRRWQTAQAA